MLKDHWSWVDCVKDLDERVTALENAKKVSASLSESITSMKAQATQMQATCGNSRGPLKTYDFKREPIREQIEATRDLYAPVRNDTEAIVKLANLARRLLDPHDLGHAVTFEVRELAREALGKEKVG